MSNGDFRRALGPWSATALVAGSMIGTGIFFFVSDVAVRLTSPGAILAAWAVGAIVASCGALSLAELAAAYPETGGIYVFLRRGYGPLVGFLYSWAKFLIMRPGSLAILAVAFAGFSIDLLGMDRESTARAVKPVAIAAILVLSAVNMIGVRAGARVQDVLTAIKVMCLLGLIGVGAAFAVGWLQSHAVSVEPAPARAGPWLVSLGAALIPILWTFGGWDESPFVAEEVRNPGRDLPLSILAGLWTVALLYLAANAAYLAILSPAEIAGTAGRTATVAMERALGPGARRVLAIALMLSTLGAANGLVLTGGRIPYAAGRDLALFRWFARTAPRAKTPVRGLAAQAALAAGAIVLFDNPFQLLLYTGLAYWLFAGLTAAAVIVLRRRDPHRARPFRVWGYPIVPALFVLASAGMAASVVVTSPSNACATGVILAVGAIGYAVQTLAFPAQDR